MKRDTDKNYTVIIKRLTDENERLKKYVETLENSIKHMKEDHDAIMKNYQDSIQEVRKIQKEYKGLIKEFYKTENKYSNKMNILITKIGGTDMNDKH